MIQFIAICNTQVVKVDFLYGEVLIFIWRKQLQSILTDFAL